MPFDVADAARLWDMLDAARAAMEFTAGQRYEDFIADRKTRNALERNLPPLIRQLEAMNVDRPPAVDWRSIAPRRPPS